MNHKPMIEDILLALALIIVVSLVWAATRHERMPPILRHALWHALAVTAGLGVLLFLLVIWPIIGTGWLAAIIGGSFLVSSVARRISKKQLGKQPVAQRTP
jgi:hypothetical protein